MNKFYSRFAVLLAVTAFVAAKDPKLLWFNQQLDHFSNSDTRTFPMRYLANDECFQFEGPLFIYIGDKEPLSFFNIDNSSEIYRLAKQHHGYLFHFEHRFYGESRTLNLDSLIIEKLRYLDTRQALADLARFIFVLKDRHGLESSQVILVGCGSGGSLATWFKQLYPDFTNGVWASSATLVAKTDLTQSKVLAGEIIRQVGGIDCYNRIKEGIVELEEMFDNERGADAKAMLRLCDSFNETNRLDVSTLFFEISEIFFKLIANHKVDEIQKECTKLNHGISHALALSYYIAGKLGGNDCNDLSYSSKFNYLKDYQRQWTYQSCNEFGWFKASNSSSQIFGTKPSVDYFVTLCADIYGYKYTREYIESKVEETNRRFDGLKPDVENVYWTNGELDPYRLLSIQTGTHAIVIPNLSHCGDMHEITPEHSPVLKSSREKLERLVREWLT